MSGDPAYVTRDEYGVLRVGNTHVMLDGIIAGYEQGHTAETIQSQYPVLSLEQVYGAIAWCLGHSSEVEEYLRTQDAAWNRARHLAQGSSPVVERLRAVRRGEAVRQP